MASTGDTGRIHLACGAAAVTALALSSQFRGLTYPDREIAQAAGGLLLDGHLEVYVRMPYAQMGPLALLLGGALPTPVYVIAMCGFLYALLLVAFRTWRPLPRVMDVVAAVVVGATWHRFALTGHADDALVLLGGVIICAGQRRNTGWMAAAGFLLAIAGKPTALLFLPLVLLVSRRAALWSVVGTAVIWLPFALPDFGAFLSAGGGIQRVMPYSLPRFLGEEAGSPYPWWVRPVQLAAGMTLCWVLGRKGGFAQAIAAALAVRVMLEPATVPLYWQSVIVGGLLIDLAARWLLPWGTLIGLAGWMVTLSYALTPEEGVARLALLAAMVVLACGFRPAVHPSLEEGKPHALVQA